MTTGFEKYRLCGGVRKPPYSTVYGSRGLR